jgi:multisubunit Na+/H+ antiporter MnhB subunit
VDKRAEGVEAGKRALTEMSSGRDGKRITAFLFGTQWWMLWHAFITLLLVPFVAVVVWLIDFQPGGGLQGGDVMAGLLLFFVMGEAPATFVHAMLFAWTRPDREPGQLLKFVAMWAVAFALFTAVLWAMVEIAAQSAVATAGRVAGILLAIVLVATLHCAGLVTLQRFRRWRAAGGVL